MSFDLLIKGARVVTGISDHIETADIGITQDRIAAMGDLSAESATTVIDATGLHLAPGFIDVHTHDDMVAINQPEMTAKLSQGVTCVIAGNCGISAAPAVLAGDPPDPMNLLGGREVFNYPHFDDYANAVDAAKPGTNIAALIGHTTLRSQVMDRFDRAATQDEIAQMQSLLRQAMREGAIGLSSGLAYKNAKATPSSEIEALLDVVAEENGRYSTHMRNEREHLLEAIEEALGSARAHHVPLVISHLKCADPENWYKSEAALKLIENAQDSQTCCCDCYPYTACSTTLDLWRVRDDFEIRITWSQPHPEQANKRLPEIAEEWGLSLLDTAKKLMPAGAVYHNMADEDVSRIVSHPLSMIGSDGLPCDPNPHPRLWGTFPRVIAHYCRDRGLMSLPEAIRKMTALPAERFGLENRGRIEVGAFADVTLFDYEHLESCASFAEPTLPAKGIETVIVNGKIAYHDGKTVNRAGKLLRKTA